MGPSQATGLANPAGIAGADRSQRHDAVPSATALRRPSDGNVWTLKYGERLDTPERFLDWLECHYRDHVEAREPGALDRLVACRRTMEVKSNQRRRRSHN